MILCLPELSELKQLWDQFSNVLKVGFGNYENWAQFEEAVLIFFEDNPEEELYIVHNGKLNLSDAEYDQYMTVIAEISREERIYLCFSPTVNADVRILKALSLIWTNEPREKV